MHISSFPVIWIRVKKVNTWVVKKMEYLDGEIDDNLDVGKRRSSGCWKKMLIWMLEKDGHLDV